MVDIQSPTAEIRRGKIEEKKKEGKKERKKKKERNHKVKYNGLPSAHYYGRP